MELFSSFMHQFSFSDTDSRCFIPGITFVSVKLHNESQLKKKKEKII